MKRAWLMTVAMLSCAAPARGESLSVMAFGGSSNWPLFVAQEKGFFAREGLDVRLAAAPDSATQMAALMQGRIDIAMTAFDNMVAYREGQVEARGGGDADLIAFLGVNDGGRIQLVAAPGIASVPELKGRRIAVDAVGSGYALVLEEMLRLGGLAKGDCELVSVGGSRARWEALRTGKVGAALLNAPYDATAQSAGFARLGSSSQAVERYQGSVGTARRAWAERNAATLVAFIRAYVAAVDWLYDRAHGEEAKAILVKRLENVTAAEAQRSYDELLDPARGSFARRAAFDLEGARTVLRLRSRYAVPPRELDDVRRYYDATYHERALASERR